MSSDSKKLIINFIVSYGREIISVICGIFTSRWTLQILGIENYGMVHVIAGMLAFVSFVNSFFAGAISRYFGVSVGKSNVKGLENEGLELCKHWFNTALSIHTVIPVLLVLFGYPIGIWAIRNWLVISVDNIEECVYIYDFIVLSCFVGMVNIPFSAMYIAKQKIAELNFYRIFGAITNVLILCWMINHPQKNWFREYVAISYTKGIIIEIILCIRAWYSFPECKVVFSYWWNVDYYKRLLKFSGIQLFGNLGELLRTQGLTIFINKIFGPSMNSTMALAQTVSGHSSKLEAALMTSLSPVLNNKAGEGKITELLNKTYQYTRIGLMLQLLLMLPVAVELDDLLKLWLKEYPGDLIHVTYMSFLLAVIMASTKCLGIAVTANGKIAKYYISLGMTNILTLPILVCLMTFNSLRNIYIVFAIMIAIKSITAIWSTFIAKDLIGFSPYYWFRHSVLPVVIVSLITGVMSFSIKFVCNDFGMLKIMMVCPVTMILFIVISFLYILSDDERRNIYNQLQYKFAKLTSK